MQCNVCTDTGPPVLSHIFFFQSIKFFFLLNIEICYFVISLYRKLSFKNYDERKKSVDKICSEAKQMQDLFKEMSHNSERANCAAFDVLPALCEVLRLKDASMLVLEVTVSLLNFKLLLLVF